ncbi:3'-5' exoribonuclease [Vibrio penaeicida]|uniref:3'-5' exoribonuclease n=1 Tax=Vibrio penaeicida TaxID=104609 RepID=UPI002732525D|nr:3'-5' exoribonuclease [Vibrio penaeicida]MDP2574208.1 3'-5' exoribonuclease [Vibrio penaeicida]
MRLYLDTEFTELSQAASLLSLALVDEQNRSLYLEVKNSPIPQDEWLQNNVIRHLKWRNTHQESFINLAQTHSEAYVTFNECAEVITQWLSPYSQGEVWTDCAVWDWLFFCELFGGAFHIPKSINYLPLDLVTLLKTKQFNPQEKRDSLIKTLGLEKQLLKRTQQITPHHALFDAFQTQVLCEHLLKEAP